MGLGSPTMLVDGLRSILDSPQMRHAITMMWDENHLRLLDRMAEVQQMAKMTGTIPSGVSPRRLMSGAEQGKRLATTGSVFSVILGPVRRGFKMGKAVDDFIFAKDEFYIAGLLMEAFENPALLADGLRINPSSAVINRIRYRMSQSKWSIAVRPKLAEEYEVERSAEDKAKKRRLDDEQKARDAAPANRGVTAPPRTSLMRPPERARSIIG
jgi:hypothetical protein